MNFKNQPLIDQLALLFSSKEEYESSITFHSFDLEKDRELNALISKADPTIITKEIIRKVKLIKTAELFIGDIDLLIGELRTYLHNKFDALAEEKFKIELIDKYIKKLNDVIGDGLKIYVTYPALEINDEFIKDYIGLFQFPQPSSPLSEDLLESIILIAEKIKNFDFKNNRFEEYTSENILSRALYHALNEIASLRDYIVYSNRYLLEDDYLIRQTGFLQITLEKKSNLSIEEDNRIRGKLSNSEIEQYFMQLTNYQGRKKERMMVLSKEEVVHFIQANLFGFEPRVEIKKFNTPGLNQSEIRRFVYTFYKKNKLKDRTDQYVHLLLNNFSLFDDTTFKAEKANFSK